MLKIKSNINNDIVSYFCYVVLVVSSAGPYLGLTVTTFVLIFYLLLTVTTFVLIFSDEQDSFVPLFDGCEINISLTSDSKI
jgi:hypothetical protein